MRHLNLCSKNWMLLSPSLKIVSLIWKVHKVVPRVRVLNRKRSRIFCNIEHRIENLRKTSCHIEFLHLLTVCAELQDRTHLSRPINNARTVHQLTATPLTPHTNIMFDPEKPHLTCHRWPRKPHLETEHGRTMKERSNDYFLRLVALAVKFTIKRHLQNQTKCSLFDMLYD